jgi:hypothetical protein
MSKFSVLDLLDLPEQERRIMLYVARNDPVTVAGIAEGIGCDMPTVAAALAVLTAQKRLRVWHDHWVTARLGHVQPRTTLPEALQPQAASGRIYSEQEIATLRTAIPMLQFARARLAMFNDHGPSHALRVGSFASQLGYALGLTPREQHLLHAGALFHDIGNVVDRGRHHIISQETVERLATSGKLPFTPKEAEVVGLLCRWHRKVDDYVPDRVDLVRGETVRTGLLAAVLRVADAMDLDYRRADYDERFLEILRFFYPEVMPYWAAINAHGIRIRCAPAIALQVFTQQGAVDDNTVVRDLRTDLTTTPFDWQVQTIRSDQDARQSATGTALLIFPFDAHSLVMAALSRQQLEAAGSTVESLCYPETTNAAAWLWQEALPDINLHDFDRLVLIGDRPEAALAPMRREHLRQWRAAGKAVTLLNRHEHTWADLPQLLDFGVEIVLSGDWGYFWGDRPGAAAIAWGRVAALCTRDATMTVGVTAADLELCQGLLAIVFDALGQRADNTADWLALAEPIMEQIASNAEGAVRRRAEHFRTHYAEAVIPGQVVGQVIVFDGAPGCLPPANYWALENAIERQGRKLERGIHFVTPYAVASWPDGNAVELLAINHWREERAVPIRLLYPTDLGSPPQGNENSLYVRLPAAQAASIVAALVAACNETEV